MGLELAAAAVVVGGVTAYQNYQNQKAVAKAGKQHNADVIRAMTDNYHQLAGAEVDTLDASYDQSLEGQAQYLQAKASAQNAAAASGVAGGSIEMLLGDLARQKDANLAMVIQNREAAFADINAQAKSIQGGANANLTAIKKPSASEAMWSGVQAGLQTYAAGASLGSAIGGASAAGAGAGAGAGASQAALQGAASRVGTNAYQYNFQVNRSPYGLV